MMRWGIDGVVLIKMGGGARYGVALAIKKVTGKPIKFMGPGGELDGLGRFIPNGLVIWIIGMGDVLTLIDKAEQVYDEEQREMIEKKAHKN